MKPTRNLHFDLPPSDGFARLQAAAIVREPTPSRVRLGLISDQKDSRKRKLQLTQHILIGKFHGQRNSVGQVHGLQCGDNFSTKQQQQWDFTGWPMNSQQQWIPQAGQSQMKLMLSDHSIRDLFLAATRFPLIKQMGLGMTRHSRPDLQQIKARHKRRMRTDI